MMRHSNSAILDAKAINSMLADMGGDVRRALFVAPPGTVDAAHSAWICGIMRCPLPPGYTYRAMTVRCTEIVSCMVCEIRYGEDAGESEMRLH